MKRILHKVTSELKKEISKASRIIIKTKRLDVIKNQATKIKNMQQILTLLERTDNKSKDFIQRDLETHYDTIGWCINQLKQGVYFIDGSDVIEKLQIATGKTMSLKFILVNIFKEREYNFKFKEYDND